MNWPVLYFKNLQNRAEINIFYSVFMCLLEKFTKLYIILSKW